MISGSKKAFSEILLVFAEKIGKNIYLLSLRDAFMLSFPLTMFGSILLVISNFPLISAEKKNVLWNLVGHSVESSMLLMAIFISLGIGYYLYKYKNPEKTSETLYSAAVALTSFFIVTPFSLTVE